MSGEPDWADEEATSLLIQIKNSLVLGDGSARRALAAQLRLVKQQGKCDGIAAAQEALKEAFSK